MVPKKHLVSIFKKNEKGSEILSGTKTSTKSKSSIPTLLLSNEKKENKNPNETKPGENSVDALLCQLLANQNKDAGDIKGEIEGLSKDIVNTMKAMTDQLTLTSNNLKNVNRRIHC